MLLQCIKNDFLTRWARLPSSWTFVPYADKKDQLSFSIENYLYWKLTLGTFLFLLSFQTIDAIFPSL